MTKLSLKERIACLLVMRMKHDETEFIVCPRNDVILFSLNNVLRLDMDEWSKKVCKLNGIEVVEE